MNFAAFDPEMFPDRVTFAAPGQGAQRTGAVAPDFPSASAETPAYVEVLSDKAAEIASHLIPEGRQGYAVFTGSQPPAGCGATWRVAWGPRVLSVVAAPEPQAGGLVWRTFAHSIN